MSCPCDKFIHPQSLNIPAGLSEFPRQIATFPEFRKAMLSVLYQKNALNGWRAREKEDLGIMLLEMWAYICDNLAFYDEVISHEEYLRTACLRPSLRKLVNLIGYIPRPAVAASVKLVVFAEGRKAIELPIGTSFRSGAFNNEPPQIFELNAQTKIHPLTNKWNIIAPRKNKLGIDNPNYLLIKQMVNLSTGKPVFIRVSGNEYLNQVAIINSIETYIDTDGNPFSKINFVKPINLNSAIDLSQIIITIPGQTAGLWTVSETPASVSKVNTSTFLILDNLYKLIKQDDYLLVSFKKEYRCFQVIGIKEVMRQPNSVNSITINNNTFNMTGVYVPVTQLELRSMAIKIGQVAVRRTNWINNSNRNEIIIHYGMKNAGTIISEPLKKLSAADPLKLADPIEVSVLDANPDKFLLEDKNQTGIIVGGKINFQSSTLLLNQGETWQQPLTLPVEVYGNVINANRGESVLGEILGSGDSSLANQSFKLKKKPLTYLPSPTAENDQGVASTLQIYVDDLLWKEVTNFFRVTPVDQVYIVRQDDKGDSIVIFGDGEHGARLPSGVNNIIANYRFGAGEACPPAGSITQIAKPAKGLSSVKNPVAAYGGSDAETSKNIRCYAPNSALILGRAVSIQDMEAVAGGAPGVRAVKSEWRWHSKKQCPSIHIWYIGEKGIESIISQRLRNISDPSTSFIVEQAQSIPVVLSIAIEIDTRFIEIKVLTQVREFLMNKETGLLSPENIGIGLPLYRSRIFESVLKIPGTLAIRNINWNNTTFSDFAIHPGSGNYFDLEQGKVLLNGREDDNG
ncbi:MAG: hypothetical protein ACM34J_01015 [Ignavibacteria bacterium]